MGFRPLNSQNSMMANLSQITDMMREFYREQVTKTFKQAGGNSQIQGKLPYTGGYGSLYYDSDNVPRILIGIAPDGEIDMAASEEGEDITTLYS